MSVGITGSNRKSLFIVKDEKYLGDIKATQTAIWGMDNTSFGEHPQCYYITEQVNREAKLTLADSQLVSRMAITSQYQLLKATWYMPLHLLYFIKNKLLL